MTFKYSERIDMVEAVRSTLHDERNPESKVITGIIMLPRGYRLHRSYTIDSRR